jgi:hypothetical protein
MRIKKWLLVVVVVAVLFTSRIYEVAGWLERYDLVRSAREFERTYLTGSSVAVIVALIVLLRGNGRGMIG